MLEDLKPPKRTYPCRVRTIAKQLEDKDVEHFLTAINDKEAWTAWALHLALKSKGIQVTDKAIRRHRDRDCSCSRLK